jgi:hypothetical protein
MTSIETITEAVTGIQIPSPLPTAGVSGLMPVLEDIATCCVKHLRSGGYIADAEGKEMLTGYLCSLTSRNPPRDFLLFTAEAQAQKHSLTVDGEVARMQKVLRGSLHGRVHYWTFGPLPGRSSSLYDHRPALRPFCSLLGCPAVIAGETSVMHVASINPVAALVAATLISSQCAEDEDPEVPFVFPFLVDLPSWNHLLSRHFAA